MYDLMVPVIFAMNMYGGKMEWKRSRQARAAPHRELPVAPSSY
jgi:hypothetical protein